MEDHDELWSWRSDEISNRLNPVHCHVHCPTRAPTALNSTSPEHEPTTSPPALATAPGLASPQHISPYPPLPPLTRSRATMRTARVPYMSESEHVRRVRSHQIIQHTTRGRLRVQPLDARARWASRRPPTRRVRCLTGRWRLAGAARMHTPRHASITSREVAWMHKHKHIWEGARSGEAPSAPCQG